MIIHIDVVAFLSGAIALMLISAAVGLIVGYTKGRRQVEDYFLDKFLNDIPSK